MNCCLSLFPFRPHLLQLSKAVWKITVNKAGYRYHHLRAFVFGNSNLSKKSLFRYLFKKLKFWKKNLSMPKKPRGYFSLLNTLLIFKEIFLCIVIKLKLASIIFKDFSYVKTDCGSVQNKSNALNNTDVYYLTILDRSISKLQSQLFIDQKWKSKTSINTHQESPDPQSKQKNSTLINCYNPNKRRKQNTQTHSQSALDLEIVVTGSK